MSNKYNTALYIGITNDLLKRIAEHKAQLVKSFTQRYNINKLVYYEATQSAYAAIQREKQLKKWNRAWKKRLINTFNPEWKDLYDELINEVPNDEMPDKNIRA